MECPLSKKTTIVLATHGTKFFFDYSFEPSS
ncbi:hypothetical protein CCACVL1_12218 [Corchorus capsularis]|uniref:Uncharacterized protein n=1 Tax=Corchorus capsularis TaxID=210143 RepID=A0A1R3IGR7_COCAP|nr:hypothetical protein CCACVL1_12218 [Corchorus capsularis]